MGVFPCSYFELYTDCSTTILLLSSIMSPTVSALHDSSSRFMSSSSLSNCTDIWSNGQFLKIFTERNCRNSWQDVSVGKL